MEEINHDLKKLVIKRKIKRKGKLDSILESQDLYFVFYQLTTEDIPPTPLTNEKTFKKLCKFLESFASVNHLVNLNFDEDLENFITTSLKMPLEWEVHCLSFLSIKNLEKYQKRYSYVKIYSLFKECVATLFDKNYDIPYISFLIKLLDNDPLVYKNLLPVISKMNLFVSENILDICITDCCTMLCAFAGSCPRYLEENLVIPLISYLVGLLQNPHNFLFLHERDIRIISKTIKALHDIRELQDTQLLQKITNRCVLKIYEYKGSTVYEELRTIVLMMEMVSYFLENSLNRSILSIENFDPGFFNFYIINDENKDSSDLILSYEYKRLRSLHNDFIAYKYRILRGSGVPYDRVTLFNDILSIDDPYELLLALGEWETQLDWSDFIGVACGSQYKVSYIPTLFRCYLNSPELMKGYMDIFYKHVAGEHDTLVYFTYFAAVSNCFELLGKLYALTAESDDILMEQIRRIVLIRINRILVDSGKATSPNNKETNDDRAVDAKGCRNKEEANAKMAPVIKGKG